MVMEQTMVKNNNTQAEQARVDFKMVTFTLAGKDYGIDIMKVKEISKASKFTFVPNAAPYVRGVYNLRGDIISVIDLRKFFNLPVEDEADPGFDNMIILRLEGHVIAVIVDSIDKVVGIASEMVQPPHPLFGDINIKYISGVVEDAGKLYVILDVERIFGGDEASESVRAAETPRIAVSSGFDAPVVEKSTVGSTASVVREDVDIGFIEETLITFMNFYSSPVNSDWIRNRYTGWKKQRGEEVQLGSEQDAEAFLSPFWSPFSNSYWNADYISKVASFMPDHHNGNFHVWNPGCSSGYESYSVACMLKGAMPNAHLRIVAHDNDLIRISTAPGLSVDKNLGAPYDKFITDGAKGGFNKEIKDSILFEYHDITHDNTLPKLDFVVMRDTVSFLSADRQAYVFGVLNELVKPGGVLLLGAHEEPLNGDAWQKVENAGVVAYTKR